MKLVDIDEEGRAHFVGDGIKRVKGTGSKELHSVNLWWIAHTFKKGHKISIEISRSNFPQWSLSPSLRKGGKDGYTLYFGEENRSKLILPILDEP